MAKEIFKVGDEVYHIEYGWGEVIAITGNFNFPLQVRFTKGEENIFSFTADGRETTESYQGLLSFTEYTLQGFSQERLIELPEVGELCLFRVADHHSWSVRKFVSYIPNAEFPYVTEHGVPYSQMKRIKILD